MYSPNLTFLMSSFCFKNLPFASLSSLHSSIKPSEISFDLSQISSLTTVWIFGSLRWLVYCYIPLVPFCLFSGRVFSQQNSSLTDSALVLSSILEPSCLGPHWFTSILASLSHGPSQPLWSFGRFGFIFVFCYFTYDLSVCQLKLLNRADSALYISYIRVPSKSSTHSRCSITISRKLLTGARS